MNISAKKPWAQNIINNVARGSQKIQLKRL